MPISFDSGFTVKVNINVLSTKVSVRSLLLDFGSHRLAKVMKTMPTANKITPYTVNSKNENCSAPNFWATEFTNRFVEVPIKVQLPPKIPAKEMGINNFGAEKLYFSESCAIILIKMTTTAVVLINDEMDAEISMKAGTINTIGRIFNFLMDCVKRSITPLSSRPIAKIISIKMVMVAELEKPLMASSGEVRPVKTSATIIRNAILSIGNASVAKSRMVTPRMINTRMISKLIATDISTD